jgi:RNA polymerase sigma factor (sigma-70 family)
MTICPTISADIHTVDITTLLRSAERGEPGCWEEIVRRYRSLIQATVAQFRLDAADRADATQSTWLRLLDKAHTIRDPECIGGWLATTARRECLALIATRNAERATDMEWDDRAASGSSPETLVMAADERRTVRAAVAELTEHSGLLIEALFGQQPMSYAEISAGLDMPIGSIGPTRARILRRLRRMLLDADEGVDERARSF